VSSAAHFGGQDIVASRLLDAGDPYNRGSSKCQDSQMIDLLVTDRLLMRPFTMADRDALVALQAEASFWWFPMRRGMTAEESEKFLDEIMTEYDSDSSPAIHAVTERDSGVLMGWGGLSVPHFLPEVLPAVEVGWRLGSTFHQHGYATELGAAALNWAFTTLALERILSIFEPDNVSSGRVMDRLGFDAGFETVHPTRQLPLRVRGLTREDWSRTQHGLSS
jgi:RimJ/RimL family protein N-acetyltransferase